MGNTESKSHVKSDDSQKMSKGITPIDDYVFTLSDELKEMAENELRETSSTRDHALKAMREWIMSNPRISNIRLDSNFLLRFLRSKKFSVPITQESLERYLLLRQSYDEKIFRNMDYLLNPIQELITNGYIFALPKRDKFGRRIILTRPGVFDPYKHANVDMLKVHGLTYETLMENEENQIRGFVHIVDASGVNLPYMTIFTPKEAVRIVKNGERTLPMRHKEIRAFNVHGSVKFAVDFALALVSEKMRNRIKICTSIESAAKAIDVTLLPKEYGGITPMADMIALWQEELKASRDVILLNDKMQVNDEMYSAKARQGAVSALTQQMSNCGAEQDANLQGLQGSFRKLEVD